jgi:hypothetical protein
MAYASAFLLKMEFISVEEYESARDFHAKCVTVTQLQKRETSFSDHRRSVSMRRMSMPSRGISGLRRGN